MICSDLQFIWIQGAVSSSRSFGGNGYESLIDLDINLNNEFLLVLNVKKTNQELYGLAMSVNLDSGLTISNAISFESDEFNQCNDLLLTEEGFYLCGDFNESLLTKGTTLLTGTGKSGYVIKFNSNFTVDWNQTIKSTIGSSFKSIKKSNSKDPIGLIEFEGELSDLNLTSKGMRDLALIRINNLNGDSIWSKQVGGNGDDENSSIILNEQGALRLILQSESGFIVDDKNHSGTAINEFQLLEFNSSSMEPVFQEIPMINFTSNEFTTTEIRVINSPFCRFSLIESPDWISIVDHGSGKASLAAVPPAQESTGSFIIRAYDLDGGFSDEEVKYQVSGEKKSMIDKKIPELFQTIDISGDGRILKIMPKLNSGYVVAGNFVNQIDFNGRILSATGRKSAFLLFLNQNMDLEDFKIISSDQEVVLTDCLIDERDNIVIFGSFKGLVKVGTDTQAYSQGEGDIFIAEITNLRTLNQFRSFGGNDNETSATIISNGDLITLSGSYWGSLNIDGTILTSESMQDGFLLQIGILNLGNTHYLLYTPASR